MRHSPASQVRVSLVQTLSWSHKYVAALLDLFVVVGLPLSVCNVLPKNANKYTVFVFWFYVGRRRTQQRRERTKEEGDEMKAVK